MVMGRRGFVDWGVVEGIAVVVVVVVKLQLCSPFRRVKLYIQITSKVIGHASRGSYQFLQPHS